MRLQYVLFGISRQPVDTAAKRRLAVAGILPQSMRNPMIARMVLMAFLSLSVLISGSADAQDVPGIEICTVEKTMERRTSCLQSNVDFLQKTITKLGIDHQQKLDAANRQIEALKSTVIGLQKTIEELQAAQKKAKEQATPQPTKDSPPPAKDGAK
jgi:TolA-binding protein